MTNRKLITKMAETIKRTIDAADLTSSAMVGHLPFGDKDKDFCILPNQLRRDLGECLDDLKGLKP